MNETGWRGGTGDDGDREASGPYTEDWSIASEDEVAFLHSVVADLNAEEEKNGKGKATISLRYKPNHPLDNSRQRIYTVIVSESRLFSELKNRIEQIRDDVTGVGCSLKEYKNLVAELWTIPPNMNETFKQLAKQMGVVVTLKNEMVDEQGSRGYRIVARTQAVADELAERLKNGFPK